jgi:hypothetical protein
MLFAITYQIDPANRAVAQDRFATTGAPPPDGVEMIARYHLAEGLAGITIAEADSAVAIARWTQEWSDCLEFDVSPVLTDEEMGEVIGG